MSRWEWRHVRARHLIVLDRYTYAQLGKRLRMSPLEAKRFAELGSLIWYAPNPPHRKSA